tara:strand:+ start:10514 stop:10675 length:162 start_codon:yes stop_codon:yes gene_type:complete
MINGDEVIWNDRVYYIAGFIDNDTVLLNNTYLPDPDFFLYEVPVNEVYEYPDV